MLHLLFDRRPWFRPKRYGYGSGLPIAWQGWLLIAAHVALILGVTAILRDEPVALAAGVTVIALVPMPLYAAKTDGGWRWRWGKKGEGK